MRLLYAFIVFAVSLQVTCYLFWAFNIFGGRIEYPLGDVASLSSLFSIDAFSVLVGVGGAVGIGLAMLLLKQGTYAIYAMLLWGFGCVFNVIKTFVLVVPNTIGALLPAATNPNPSLFPVNPLLVVIVFFFSFGAWWFLLSLVLQREIA